MQEIKSNEFYLYGFSEYARCILQVLKKKGLKPLAIIDKAKTGQFEGIKIAQCKDLELITRLPILVTILGYPEVNEELAELGFKQQIHPITLFKEFPESIALLVDNDFMWRKRKESFSISNQEKVRLKNICGDHKSKYLLDQILNFRENPTYKNYPKPEENYPMYFPNDIDCLYEDIELRILDIGAYDGDTLSDFLEHNSHNIREYCCIEANPTNIIKLVKKIQQNNIKTINIELLEGAVGVKTKSDYITISDFGSASKIGLSNSSDQKSFKTKVLNIKEIVSKKKPNIIKMDIEGCDLNALKEMKSYIISNSPTLALSIYHQPKDLWEMPLYIDEISNGKYSIFIRQEGHWGLETQLYAIPKK